jgi:hypothetical protein
MKEPQEESTINSWRSATTIDQKPSNIVIKLRNVQTNFRKEAMKQMKIKNPGS